MAQIHHTVTEAEQEASEPGPESLQEERAAASW
jgi:hypothetical protein